MITINKYKEGVPQGWRTWVFLVEHLRALREKGKENNEVGQVPMDFHDAHTETIGIGKTTSYSTGIKEYKKWI